MCLLNFYITYKPYAIVLTFRGDSSRFELLYIVILETSHLQFFQNVSPIDLILADTIVDAKLTCTTRSLCWLRCLSIFSVVRNPNFWYDITIKSFTSYIMYVKENDAIVR